MTGAVRVLLFHRDLRLHDHPALVSASETAEALVPLFVVDRALPSSPHRNQFLRECLMDLRESLRRTGADLVVRAGDPVAEAVAVAVAAGATGIDATADVSAYAVARQQRLAAECERQRLELRLHPGITVVPPGELRPSGSGGDYYRVFTPYWRVWQAHRWRPEYPAPGRIRLPPGLTGDDPTRLMRDPATSPDLLPGGESAGLKQLRDWEDRLPRYPDTRDNLAADQTSRLSAYLHFGAVSARAVAARCAEVGEFVRQLCWRDFYHQILAGFPQLPRRNLRASAATDWRYDEQTLTAWSAGDTGVPIVDAGMRQLASTGYLPNRARLITASYLVKILGLDWRDGAAWYHRMLVDADVANNYGNWQWVAGTGGDARPHRGFNPIRQARRFDPQGEYVRRWIPELSEVDTAAVHEPWRLPEPTRRRLDYPPPIHGTPGGAADQPAYGAPGGAARQPVRNVNPRRTR